MAIRATGSHWVVVRKKAAFLHRLMTELAGDSRISLEGDLSRCDFADHFVVSLTDWGTLRRASLLPEQDFVVLRLNDGSLDPIFKEIMSAGLKEAIVHVQIEQRGLLQLGAYDNFHRDCVVTGPGISRELLTELKACRLLWDFTSKTEEQSCLFPKVEIAYSIFGWKA